MAPRVGVMVCFWRRVYVGVMVSTTGYFYVCFGFSKEGGKGGGWGTTLSGGDRV